MDMEIGNKIEQEQFGLKTVVELRVKDPKDGEYIFKVTVSSQHGSHYTNNIKGADAANATAKEQAKKYAGIIKRIEADQKKAK